MIEAIIAEAESLFRKGVFVEKTSFNFILDEAIITIIVDAQSCSIYRGAVEGKADCSCETSAEMFRRIWYDGYKPGLMEFLGGAIKCDAPLLLPQFLKAFGK